MAVTRALGNAHNTFSALYRLELKILAACAAVAWSEPRSAGIDTTSFDLEKFSPKSGFR